MWSLYSRADYRATELTIELPCGFWGCPGVDSLCIAAQSCMVQKAYPLAGRRRTFSSSGTAHCGWTAAGQVPQRLLSVVQQG